MIYNVNYNINIGEDTMDRKDRNENVYESCIDVSEINNFPGIHAHYSIESTNIKPYDISKMTGQPVNQGNNDGSDENN